MKFFEEFTSVTYASTANQKYTKSDNEVHTGRVFYKLYAGGKHRYSFLFTNIIDGTIASGDESRCNMILDSWEILSLRLATTKECPVGEATEKVTMSTKGDAEIKLSKFIDLTFNKKKSKTLAPGEFFNTDPVTLNPGDNDYFCLEITFKGKAIPTHPETRVATFLKEGEEWVHSTDMPLPCMVGSDRPVKHKIAYFGDSITAGVGTDINSYEHWNALVSEELGKENAYWNIGCGYGTSGDAASGGAWMFKAKQNDFVVLSFGCNDLFWEPSKVKVNLARTVKDLTDAGVKVFVQTLHPFNQQGEMKEYWLDINKWIEEELAPTVTGCFKTYTVMGESPENPTATVYGDHPNSAGCKVWADGMLPLLKEAISKAFGE